MARMASRPRIGGIIRAAMEREHMDQIQLAQALDVSRSAVNAWINDRAWPMNRIAALEDLLGIKIPRTLEEQQEASPAPANGTPRPPADPWGRELFDLLTSEDAPPGDRLTPAEAWNVIEYARRAKRRTA
jgi:transcriptional regulator with XRE-family HTH domain